MTIETTLRAVAAHGLAMSPDPPPRVPPEQAPLLLAEAYAHKLIGLLDQAVAEGAVRCESAGVDQVGEMAVLVAAWSLQLERRLLAVDDLFARHGVPHRFVKGATIAHRFYDHPALRMSVDVDVLVPTGRLDQAVAVLADAAHERDQSEPYRGFSRRYAKSVTMRHRTGAEIDVHRIIADGPFGLRATHDVLWSRPSADVQIGGRLVPALDPVAAFVHACVNAVASYDRVSLASLRDVAQVGQAVAGDVPAVRELADELAVGACVTEAVRQTSVELGWRAPASIEAIADWPVSRRERQWLDSYRERPSDARRALLGMHAVPGVRAKVAYLASVGALLSGRPARRRARPGGPPHQATGRSR